jgi:hypothetical protein
MNFQLTRLVVVGTVTTMLGANLAQAALADHDKITTVTTRNYATPVTVSTPVIIEQPTTTTTTVRRTIDAPVSVAQPVVVERQVLIAPVVQERRVEMLNTNMSPTTSSTTVTRTTTLEP